MPRRKNIDPDDPKILNFDHDEERGIVEPFMSTEDERGDDEDDQYYEEEEFLSPEEVLIRKKDKDLSNNDRSSEI